MLLLFLVESSGYQYQDGIRHPQQHFSAFSLRDTQILLHILQGVLISAKLYLKRLILTH
jgi:hypothetical protein